MLVTTTPALLGRRYREIGVVVAASPPLKEGASASYVVNGFLSAIAFLEAEAVQQGGNALIGVHTVMSEQFYILITGTVIWLDDAGDEVPLSAEEVGRPMAPDCWDFLPTLTQDL